MIAKRGVAVAVLAGALLAGCRAKQSATMEPAVEQGDGMPRTPSGEERAEQLGEAVEEFAAARKGLLGHADEPSRRQLSDALGKLAQVLTLLRGPQQDGAFRQQMRIIDRARTQLTSDAGTAPEPTINSALRAAQNALDDLARERFAGDETVMAGMDALRPRIDVLARVRGPIHGFEASRALDALGAAVERMAEVQQQRMEQAQPATAPAAAAAPDAQ